MSLAQVSSAPKIEDAVYLGLSTSIVIFFGRFLFPNFPSNENALFLIALFSALLSAFLYYSKLDKLVELLYSGIMKSYQEEIRMFMAKMDIFVKVWETSATEAVEYEKRAEQATKTAIEGYDLYGNMWSQKGLFFFMLSIPFIMGF